MSFRNLDSRLSQADEIYLKSRQTKVIAEFKLQDHVVNTLQVLDNKYGTQPFKLNDFKSVYKTFIKKDSEPITVEEIRWAGIISGNPDQYYLNYPIIDEILGRDPHNYSVRIGDILTN